MLVSSPQGMQSLGNSSAIQRGLEMIMRQTQNTQEECHTLHTRQEQFVIQYQEVIKLQGKYLCVSRDLHPERLLIMFLTFW